MITADYGSDADRFHTNLAKAERTACPDVERIDSEGLTITLIGGIYHPWYSDSAYGPGLAEIWHCSDAYSENHPIAVPLMQIRCFSALSIAAPSRLPTCDRLLAHQPLDQPPPGYRTLLAVAGAAGCRIFMDAPANLPIPDQGRCQTCCTAGPLGQSGRFPRIRSVFLQVQMVLEAQRTSAC